MYRKNLILILFIFGIFLAVASQAQAATTNQISQYGITWYFDQEYEYGAFANGDYWVKGPVTITRITPDEIKSYSNLGSGICNQSNGKTLCLNDCAALNLKSYCACPNPLDNTCATATKQCVCSSIRHGWQVNPIDKIGQGFDDREDYLGSIADARLIPALPYVAQPNESIVKAISYDINNLEPARYNILQTAAVLTVVGEIPENNGLTLFRPPYMGTEKPFYSTVEATQRARELLPSYVPVPNTPTLEAIENRFRKVQLDHLTGDQGASLHPRDHYGNDGYGAAIGRDNAIGVLRLFLNEPFEEKKNLLYYYLQFSIDQYHSRLNGRDWTDTGEGMRPGQLLPLAFGSLMLNNVGMKNVISDVGIYDDNEVIQWGEKAQRGLYGKTNDTEYHYWEVVATNSGGRSIADPYGYIDGGCRPGGGYQFCCMSHMWKGEVIALQMMPTLKEIWNDKEIIDYADRWVNIGAWAQPDPCAPADGVCSGGAHSGSFCTSASELSFCKDGDSSSLAVCDLTVNFPSHYGVTYGPDGKGGCILDTNQNDGVGRFPQYQGNGRDTIGGPRVSPFINSIWSAYRGPSCYDGVCNGDETNSTCPYDCAISNCLLGDLDCQSGVTITDIQIAVNVFLGIETDETKRTRANVDTSNSDITIADIQKVVNIFLNID